MPRLLAAFLLAPFVGLVGGALVTWLLFAFDDSHSLSYAALMVLVGAFYAYPAVFIFGVPVFFVLRHFQVGSLWPFVGLGALLGTIGWFVAASPFSSPQFYARAISEAIFGLVAGMLGAAAFWHIAVRRHEP